MDKRLVLLGVLRSQRTHGYGLLEYLGNHSSASGGISKSNAYRLLKQLEEGGFICSHTERDGNRPERQVYKVTEAGEALFCELLKAAMADDGNSDLPGNVALNYIDSLAPDVAAEALTERLRKVEQRMVRFADLPEQVLEFHPAVELAINFMNAEHDWLVKTIAKLASASELSSESQSEAVSAA